MIDETQIPKDAYERIAYIDGKIVTYKGMKIDGFRTAIGMTMIEDDPEWLRREMEEKIIPRFVVPYQEKVGRQFDDPREFAFVHACNDFLTRAHREYQNYTETGDKTAPNRIKRALTAAFECGNTWEDNLEFWLSLRAKQPTLSCPM